MHVHNFVQRNCLEAGSTREKKGREERRYARNSVWQFGTLNRKCRWHARVYPERENKSGFTTPTSRALDTVQSTLGAGGCGNIFFCHVLVAVHQGQRRDTAATGEFTKASAATLLQQEKSDSADVQRDRLNMSKIICTVVSYSSRRV